MVLSRAADTNSHVARVEDSLLNCLQEGRTIGEPRQPPLTEQYIGTPGLGWAPNSARNKQMEPMMTDLYTIVLE